jgi:hypothetical protein
MTKNILPHRRCPCGSKKKYRNCCGKQKTVSFHDLPKETQDLVRKTQLKYQLATQYHKNHLGHTPAIVSTIFQGRRIVGLGGALVQSDNPEREWNEPAEFLTSHLKTILGNQWFDDELKNDRKDRHLILNWAVDSNYEILDATQPLDSRKLNGSALAYLHLAYDLFVLHNAGHVTDKLISRLKSEQGFNDARYELFVLATMIRAGFKIEPFDETLGVCKMTECKATHIDTGAVIQVEAKTRNVKYVLGSKEGKTKSVRLYDKLREAIEKDIKQPYIVFVDLNFPEFEVVKDGEKLVKVRHEHEKLIEKFPDNLPNAIIYTNIPFHYARDGKDTANTAFGIIKVLNPKIPLKNEDAIIEAIHESLGKYHYLPREFNESEKFADEIINKRGKK